jgi:hypothetical protein
LNYRACLAALLVTAALAALAALARDSSSAVVSSAAYGYEYEPGVDLVAGTGKRLNLGGFSIEVHVDAQSGSAGQNAHGRFWVSTETPAGTLVVRGRVNCLTVAGNRAAARGTVEESSNPQNPVGSDLQVQVTDNGKLADTNINFFGFGPGDTGCPIIPFAERPITQGNFFVHDR